jgi:hypothetical protein
MTPGIGSGVTPLVHRADLADGALPVSFAKGAASAASFAATGPCLATGPQDCPFAARCPVPRDIPGRFSTGPDPIPAGSPVPFWRRLVLFHHPEVCQGKVHGSFTTPGGLNRSPVAEIGHPSDS